MSRKYWQKEEPQIAWLQALVQLGSLEDDALAHHPLQKYCMFYSSGKFDYLKSQKQLIQES